EGIRAEAAVPSQPAPAESVAAAAISLPPAVTPPAPRAPENPAEPEAPRAVVPVWPKGTPLGDVARYYRERKEKRAAPVETPVAVIPNELPQRIPAGGSSARPPAVAGAPATKQPLPASKKRILAVATAASDPLPEARVVRARRGDSLWKLAARYLGKGGRWREIAAVNPHLRNVNHIRAGEPIRLPGSQQWQTPVAVSPLVIEVQAGDTLWSLARARWGSGRAWSCIAAANPHLQVSSKIYPGQTLALPPACLPGT
ncbi:MAG TPA: LysM peptidoglycan-binding domain-containing protein, partial [Terriglobia bacterium]|nr:LysM peptidoglycan-binding domain-containing protein [Terriglobia bacterium]